MCQIGNKNEFLECQPGGNDGLSQLGDVVFISVGDPLDKAVKPQPFKDSRDSGWAFVREELTQRGIPEASNVELAAGQGW